MSQEDSDAPADAGPEIITITDKRRVDPQTGAIRPGASDPAPGGPASEAPAATDSADGADGAAAKVAELTADLQRVQADFANYRKRALREQQAAVDRAKASVITQLLSILDDLERARSHGDLESGPLKAFADNLTGVLSGLGLAAFGAEGDDFDPVLHEAVQHEGDGSHPVIGAVLRQGYTLGEQVLRHAMVGVVDTVPDEAVETGDTDVSVVEDGGQGAESEAPTD